MFVSWKTVDATRAAAPLQPLARTMLKAPRAFSGLRGGAKVLHIKRDKIEFWHAGEVAEWPNAAVC